MRPQYRRPLFAVLVLVVLAGVYAAASRGRPANAAGHSPVTSASVAVTSVVRVCPGPGSPGLTASSVALAAVPAKAATGAAVLTRLTPSGSTAPGPKVTSISQPGLLRIAAVPVAPPLPKGLKAGVPGASPAVTTQAARGGVVVTASGGMAQGLEVEQAGPGGLVTEQCESPGTDFWFVGPGQVPATDIELYLMNSGSQAADAAVSFLTDATKGAPLLGNADNGIQVPPHGMVVQSLGKLLTSAKIVALNVSTSVGEVAAAVRETSSAGDAGAWLPPTEAPSKTLVIPGMPSSSGQRELYIGVPGSATASVKITAVTSRGSYQPTGGNGIDLLGGSISEVALPSLDGIAGAIKISASVPVTASMLLPGGPAGTPGALAAAAGPVQEQGVAADNPAKGAGTVQLVLSAPGASAAVRVTEATSSTAAAGQAGQTVQVKAGSTVVVPVKPPSGGTASPFTIIVTPLPGSGPVYAARLVSTGGVVRSILPIPSSLTSVRLVPVTSSLSGLTN
jgi:hypothetical protein